MKMILIGSYIRMLSPQFINYLENQKVWPCFEESGPVVGAVVLLQELEPWLQE